jgi:hypothetical protein
MCYVHTFLVLCVHLIVSDFCSRVFFFVNFIIFARSYKKKNSVTRNLAKLHSSWCETAYKNVSRFLNPLLTTN